MQYHNTLDALTYYQTGAECKALYLQSFLLARLALEQQMKSALAAGRPASQFYIVSDCDETLLDNSAYNAWNLTSGRDFFPANWSAWCQEEKAEATPGAVEFVHFADQLHVPVYYVSSRYEHDRVATANNLRKLTFPVPDASDDARKSRLFLENMVIKDAKTRKIEQYTYLENLIGAKPLLTLGDNLSDHDPVLFDKNKNRHEEREQKMTQNKDNVGTKWILFPNPIYGGWRETLRVKAKVKTQGGEVEAYWPVNDEPSPVNNQGQPVRPGLTSAEAPKTGLLHPWAPKP